MSFLKRSFTTATLLGYILLSVFGLLAMGEMHNHSMYSMGNCPFMVGEHSLCTMDFTEHISAWSSLTTTTLAELLILIPLVFVFFLPYLRPPNLARSKLFEEPHRERFITTLFSQGILHPKAP